MKHYKTHTVELEQYAHATCDGCGSDEPASDDPEERA